ncbi:hypothetical protein EV363DRAFT_1182903, partial [Boletus edulis]
PLHALPFNMDQLEIAFAITRGERFGKIMIWDRFTRLLDVIPFIPFVAETYLAKHEPADNPSTAGTEGACWLLCKVNPSYLRSVVA